MRNPIPFRAPHRHTRVTTYALRQREGIPYEVERVLKMVEVMESYFGSCTMFRECEAVCPKNISVDFIARMNRDYLAATLK